MDKKSSQVSNIDDIRQEVLDNKRPRYLYKYRSIDRATEFLESNSIYFSNYKEFNDPFESACKKKYDFTPKQYFETFQKWGVNFIDSAIKAEQIRLGMVNPEDLLKKSTDMIFNRFSYFSMAEEPDNILMWSHYADSHKGVCFRFDLLQDFDTFLITVPVDYNSEYPEFDTLNENPSRIIIRKSPYWSYEKEHRTIKVNSPGLHEINKKALVEIIFGCRTSTEDKNEIKRFVEQNEFYDVQFSEAIVNPNAYQLDIIPLIIA